MFATEKEMKAEAIRRMKLLGLNEECIEAFDKENRIMIAMSPIGIFANPNEKTIEEIKAFDLNDSIIHVDFMIGSADLSIVATTFDGKEVQIFENGTWAI